MSKYKWWNETFEKMNSPLEKFQYLTGLSELSWDDCQDAWFESKKLIPEVAKELATLKAEVELLNAKVKSLEDELPEYCGKNDVFPKGRVGCGEPFVWSPQVFRCVDCSMPFHKHCLKKHCDDDLANVRTDLEREREANAKLREALENIIDAESKTGHKCYYSSVVRKALLAAKQDEGNG